MVCGTEQLRAPVGVTMHPIMLPGSPARHTVCRFCGLHAEPHGHASLTECVVALEGEVNLLRAQVRQREPRAAVDSPTATGTFRDRRLR